MNTTGRVIRWQIERFDLHAVFQTVETFERDRLGCEGNP